MAQKNRNDRTTDVTNLFPSSGNQEINAERLRNVSNDDIDSTFSLLDDTEANINTSDPVKYGATLSDALDRLRGRYGTATIGDLIDWPVGFDSFNPTGDIASVVSLGSKALRVTLTDALHNTNYIPVFAIESLGTFNFDNDVAVIPFKKVSQTEFTIFLDEIANITQDIILHIHVRAF